MGSYHATWEEADEERLALLKLMDEAGLTASISLGDWGERCLTRRELSGDIEDVDSDRGRWTKHILPHAMAKLALKSVQRRDVVEWLDLVRSKVKAQNHLNLLRVIFRMGIEEGLIKENPCSHVRLPRQRRTHEPWSYATAQEQGPLVAAVDGPERWIVAFAMGSGLRAGELVSLRRSDVHLHAKVPYVVVRYGKPPNEPTKTGKIREVPLFGIALHALGEWLKALPSFCKRNPHGLVFPRERGGFRSVEHVLTWTVWKAALQRAKIVRAFRWHDLRHTCASSLVSGWWGRAWSLEEVRDMLGHSSITVTERYAHLAATAVKRAAEETQYRTAIAPDENGHKPLSSGNHRGAPETNRTSDQRFRKPLRPESSQKLSSSKCDIGAIAKKVVSAAQSGSPHFEHFALELADAVLAHYPQHEHKVRGAG